MSGDLILLRCKSCRTVNRLPPDKLDSNPICGKCKTPLEYPRLPVHGTALNFEQEVLEWHGVSLVEFWAKWCGACRIIAPVLDQLAAERAGRLKVVKIDVDEEPNLAGRFHIKATPTVLLYQNGSKVNEIAGSLDKKQLEDWIDGSLRV